MPANTTGRGAASRRSIRGVRWVRSGASRGAVVGWLVVLITAAIGAASLSDNSFLTHLTTGRLILDGDFPRADPYSFTATGQPWVVQSWFASLLYASTAEVGHGVGLRAMIAVLSGLLGAILWRLTRATRSVVARLAAVAPAVIVGSVLWGHRPLLFGLLGFATVLLVLREERDPRWLVPVMWVWVNSHGSFPLGVALVLVYGVGVWCDRGSVEHVVRTLKWIVVGILVGALNPLGLRLLWFPVELLQKQDVLSFMVEWQAPSFTSLWERVFLGTVAIAVILVPRLAQGDRYRVLIPAVVFVALGLTASRNIVLATILLTPLLAVELAGLGSLSSRVRARAYSAVCVALAIYTVGVVGFRLSQPSFDLSGYPVAAVDWLEDHGKLGRSSRVATRDTVGNYLEFRTRGTVPVFVDDRVDMFPSSVIEDEKTLLDGRPEWAEVLERYDVDTVLWQEDRPLATILGESSDWQLSQRFAEADGDTAWVVYERVKPIEE